MVIHWSTPSSYTGGWLVNDWSGTVVSGALLISVSDSVAASEQVTVVLQAALAVADSVTASENAACKVSSVVGVADASTASENVTTSEQTAFSVVDSSTTAEGIALLSIAMPFVSDSVTLSEQTSFAAISVLISALDSVLVSESSIWTGLSTLSVADTSTVSEAVTLFLLKTLMLLLSDAVTVAENAAAVFGITDLVVSDSSTVSENISFAAIAFAFMVSDRTLTSENENVLSAMALNIEDDSAVSEFLHIFNTGTIFNVSVLDTTTASEHLGCTVGITLTAFDLSLVTEYEQAAFVYVNNRLFAIIDGTSITFVQLDASGRALNVLVAVPAQTIGV